jgi:hypothetical protein
MAEQASTPSSYPYVNTVGKMVDLAIKDEVLMAHVCHYMMTHTADKLFLTPPIHKKQ